MNGHWWTAPRILALAFAVYAALVAVFVGAEYVVAGRSGPPIDDGWIYMAFARALAAGEGMTYPGYDGTVCSVTGPVWNAILAVAFAFFGPSVAAAKACGVLTGLFAIWSVYRLGCAATRRDVHTDVEGESSGGAGDARLAAVAALILAATPRFVWGSLSIMEVPFFIATVCWGLALHIERRRDTLIRWLPALVVLTLAGWARPECFVFPVFAALDRRRLRDILVCGGLLALYPAYHLALYGHPLPTTFYAKASGAAPWSIYGREGLGAAALAVLRNPFHELLAFVSYLPTYLPVLAVGVIPGVRRAVRERSGVRILGLMMLGFVFARGMLGVTQPAFQYGRYFPQVYAGFVVLALYGFDWGARSRAHRVAVVAYAAVAVLAVVFPYETLFYAFDWTRGGVTIDADAGQWIFWVSTLAGVLLLGVGALRRRPAPPPVWAAVLWLCVASGFGAAHHGRNVADTYALNVTMAERAREVVPVGEQIACHDIGALGYFADRPMLDLAGLGSPEVAFGPRREDGSIDGRAVILETRPRWLCLTEDMFNAVMAGSQALPGLVGVEVHVDLNEPANITLLGSRYMLIELRWD